MAFVWARNVFATVFHKQQCDAFESAGSEVGSANGNRQFCIGFNIVVYITKMGYIKVQLQCVNTDKYIERIIYLIYATTTFVCRYPPSDVILTYLLLIYIFFHNFLKQLDTYKRN